MIALLEFHDRAYRDGGGGGHAQNAEAMFTGRYMIFTDKWAPEYIGNLIFPMGENGRSTQCRLR